MKTKKFPQLKNKAMLSPMAGVTDVAFRALCKKYGAVLTCTEFVSSIGVNRKNRKSLEMLKTDIIEVPKQVQLFGNSEEDVINAAKNVSDMFDIIDINCGCPAWKVIKTGAGSELLKNPMKIGDFVKKLNKAVKNPITIKIRKGIDDSHNNAVEVALLAEKAGASAIAIHGRTQKQGYSGKADWEIIKKVKLAVKIPVIGNGDVFTPEDFKEKLDYSKVDYIMIARGAIGNPYIFKQINDYLLKREYYKKDKIELFFEYYELAIKHSLSFSQIKKQAVMFTKGIPNSSQLRVQITQTKNKEELIKIMKYFQAKELNTNTKKKYYVQPRIR
ncbi:tRNA dihydrouridine synthase DusB [Candidatus Pacearchaeota archaeon]|nr:tRNA dihydrouridine synthase DusB [Candidatus Pacearchaeota archaeon]